VKASLSKFLLLQKGLLLLLPMT